MIDLKNIYYDLGNSLRGICDNLYPENRPKAVDEKVNSYIVVSCPYTIRNNEINDDGCYNDYTTTVQIGIYVRDKVQAKNPNTFDVPAVHEKIKTVMEKFPISTNNILVTKPRITLQTDDGCGFSVTVIQGKLRTK